MSVHPSAKLPLWRSTKPNGPNAAEIVVAELWPRWPVDLKQHPKGMQ